MKLISVTWCGLRSPNLLFPKRPLRLRLVCVPPCSLACFSTPHTFPQCISLITASPCDQAPDDLEHRHRTLGQAAFLTLLLKDSSAQLSSHRSTRRLSPSLQSGLCRARLASGGKKKQRRTNEHRSGGSSICDERFSSRLCGCSLSTFLTLQR